jgi:hypothetical protein
VCHGNTIRKMNNKPPIRKIPAPCQCIILNKNPVKF